MYTIPKVAFHQTSYEQFRRNFLGVELVPAEVTSLPCLAAGNKQHLRLTIKAAGQLQSIHFLVVEKNTNAHPTVPKPEDAQAFSLQHLARALRGRSSSLWHDK